MMSNDNRHVIAVTDPAAMAAWTVVGNVLLNKQCTLTESADLMREGLGFFGIGEVIDRDVGARLRQRPCGGTADAGGSASDEGSLP